MPINNNLAELHQELEALLRAHKINNLKTQ